MTKVAVYDSLRIRLLAGEFAAGQRLSPDAIAQQTGTSIGPIREALHLLASEGFVEHIPRRGMFVRQRTRQELIELLELREVLECHAASVAARRITDAELDDLQRHVGQMKAQLPRFATMPNEEATEAWQLADLAFHLTILRAAGNRETIKVLHNTEALLQTFGFRTDPPDAWPNFVQYMTVNWELHDAIFEAIRNHSSENARTAMIEHHARARRNLLGRFDALEQNIPYDQPSPPGDFPREFRQRIEKKASE